MCVSCTAAAHLHLPLLYCGASTDLPEPVGSPGAELKRTEEEEEEVEVSHGWTHSNVTQAAHTLIRLMAKIILLETQVQLLNFKSPPDKFTAHCNALVKMV